MSNSSRIGATAVDALKALLEDNAQIAALAVFEPAPVPLAQDRLPSDEGSASILEAGLAIRRDLGLPFWDAVLLSCFGSGLVASHILDKALFHNSPPRRLLWVSRYDWSAKHLAGLIQEVEVGRILVVSSRARLSDGTYAHLPMIDFHCPVSKANQEMSALVARLLQPSGGYLLSSGQSYHFYGKALIPEEDFVRFLGRVLLLSPIIDRSWVAHQLIEGACGLRISPKSEDGEVPRVVVEL
jgi:hypothetical protein